MFWSLKNDCGSDYLQREDLRPKTYVASAWDVERKHLRCWKSIQTRLSRYFGSPVVNRKRSNSSWIRVDARSWPLSREKPVMSHSLTSAPCHPSAHTFLPAYADFESPRLYLHAVFYADFSNARQHIVFMKHLVRTGCAVNTHKKGQQNQRVSILLVSSPHAIAYSREGGTLPCARQLLINLKPARFSFKRISTLP